MSVETAARVKLHLAGAFLLTVDDQPIHKFHSNKTQALLAYLALEAAEPLSRDHIAHVLWAGYTRRSGRATLRMTLSNLRRVLGPFSDLIVATRNKIQLRRDHPEFWCDVLHLRQFVHNPLPERFEAVLKKYDRLLLVGFDAVDSDAYLSWLTQQREAYASLMLTLQTQAAQKLRPQHNLPRLLTPVFGRSADIYALKGYLTEPNTPLVTLIGPGGVGKTTLAIAAAKQLTQEFPSGVWFVPLDRLAPTAGRDSTHQVATAIAHTLSFTPHPARPLTTQLIEYLSTQQMLLVLDNFEHVQDAAPFMLELLAATSRLTILTTSRQRLNVMTEQIVRLYGLPTPTDDERDAPSMALFGDRLRRVARSLTLDDENWRAVGTICRMLNGLPLGIELAAIACEQTTPTRLQQHLASNLSILQTEMVSFPDRHRNLWSIVEYSWDTLPMTAQRVLLQCALLNGTFSAEAITRITQASHTTIDQLAHYALLTPVGEDSYQMHAQLRDYCEQKTASAPALRGWVNQARQRHAAYYLNWLAGQLPLLLSQPAATVGAIRQQLDNVKQAWQWAVDHLADEYLAESCTTLAIFFQIANSADVGIDWFEAAVSQHHVSSVQGRLLTGLAALHVQEGAYEAAYRCVMQVREATSQLPSVQAEADLVEGLIYLQHADTANGVAALQDALAFYEEALSAESLYPADPYMLTLLRHRAVESAYALGRGHYEMQQWAAAGQVWEQGGAWAEVNGNQAQQIDLHRSLGSLAYKRADYKIALEHCQRGIAATKESTPAPQLHYYAGLSALQLNLIDAAQTYLKTVVEQARALHQDALTVQALLALGATQLAVRQVQAARQSAYSALGIVRRIGRPDLSVPAHHLLATVHTHTDAKTMAAEAQQVMQQLGQKPIPV